MISFVFFHEMKNLRLSTGQPSGAIHQQCLLLPSDALHDHSKLLWDSSSVTKLLWNFAPIPFSYVRRHSASDVRGPILYNTLLYAYGMLQ